MLHFYYYLHYFNIFYIQFRGVLISLVAIQPLFIVQPSYFFQDAEWPTFVSATFPHYVRCCFALTSAVQDKADKTKNASMCNAETLQPSIYKLKLKIFDH